MGLIIRGNNALKVNPNFEDFALTTHGSDWLWAVCAVYCVILLLVIGLTFVARQGEKIFHYLFTISLFTGAIAYFAMASDLGSTSVRTVQGHSGTRQIFYARYINWFIGWTPILFSLGLVSGVSWATIIYNIALSYLFITSYLLSALVSTKYKWGFFAFGTVALFILLSSLVLNGFKTSSRLGNPVRRDYKVLVAYFGGLSLLYPIAFGIDDGGNKISVTHGFVFWGILDLATVPVLVLLMLVGMRKWDFKVLNVYFTQYGRVVQGGEFPEREKVEPVQQQGTGVVESV